MNCPIDHSELHAHAQSGIAFHFCGACQGMFFTKDNLLNCLRAGKVTTECGTAPRVTADVTAKVIRRECPSCHAATMVDKLLDEIAIDICPDCKGVWLDAGELERIVERHHRRHGDADRGHADYVSDAADVASDVVRSTGDDLGDVAAAVGDFISGSGEWLSEAGSSVGEFFTIDF